MGVSINDDIFKDASVETSASYFWIENDNIVRIVNKPCAVHHEKDATENILLLREKVKGVPPLLLIDTTHIKSMTREAREVYAKESIDKRVKAIALVTSSTLGRIVANFFFGFNKPEVPIKLFNNDTAAREWLKKQK